MVSLLMNLGLLATASIVVQQCGAVGLRQSGAPMTADAIVGALKASIDMIDSSFHDGAKEAKLAEEMKGVSEKREAIINAVCLNGSADHSTCVESVGEYLDKCKHGLCFKLKQEQLNPSDPYPIKLMDHNQLSAAFKLFSKGQSWMNRRVLRNIALRNDNDNDKKGFSSIKVLIDALVRENIQSGEEYTELQRTMGNFLNAAATAYKTFLVRSPSIAYVSAKLDIFNFVDFYFRPRLRKFLKEEFSSVKNPVSEEYLKTVTEEYKEYLKNLGNGKANLANRFSDTVLDVFNEFSSGKSISRRLRFHFGDKVDTAKSGFKHFIWSPAKDAFHKTKNVFVDNFGLKSPLVTKIKDSTTNLAKTLHNAHVNFWRDSTGKIHNIIGAASNGINLALLGMTDKLSDGVNALSEKMGKALNTSEYVEEPGRPAEVLTGTVQAPNEGTLVGKEITTEEAPEATAERVGVGATEPAVETVDKTEEPIAETGVTPQVEKNAEMVLVSA